MVSSKLVAPAALRGAVLRARLDVLLSSAERIALVVAPPGYGKTVAVRHWIDGESDPTAWVALDLLDRNSASFWLHVIRALQTVFPHVDAEPEMLLEERGPRDAVFLGALVAGIERSTRRAVLVLDDVSTITDRSVFEGIAFMVDRIGHLLRFVIVARSDPPLPVSRWYSADWIAEVREQDLRLRDDEALAVAASFGDVALSEKTVISLNERTEGWPVGLHLALLSLRSSPDPEDQANAVVSSDRLLADYLVAEVLDQLPDGERDAALALSVLDWFDDDLCIGLLGADGDVVAHQLQRRRLFLTTTDDHVGAMRFHALIRQLLESELRWRDPERRIALHRRAASLCFARADIAAAHRHLMVVGDRDAARKLVIDPVLELVDCGDRFGIAQVLRDLPDEMAVDSATLAVDLAVASFFGGQDAAATEWCDLADRFVVPGDDAAELSVQTARGMIALMRGDLVAAADHVARYEDLARHNRPNGDVESRFASTAARVMLAARRFGEARHWINRASEITGPEAVTSVSVPTVAAWYELECGDLREGLRTAERAVERAEVLGLRPHLGAFDAIVVAAWCRVGMGDLAGAGHFADVARTDADTLAYEWNRIRAGVLGAEIRRLADGPDAALDAVRELRCNLDRREPGHLADELDVVEAHALIGSGAQDEARRIIDRVAAGPRQRLLLARLAATTGTAQQVERLVRDRAGWTTREQLDADLIRASLPGNARAEQQVTAAVERAATTGWVSPFLGHGEALSRLLGRLRVDELHPALAEALRRQPPVTRHVVVTAEDLTARETTILELLPTYMSYAQIGERLYLSINTVKGNLKTIYRKLGVTSRSAAVDAARRAGLV